MNITGIADLVELGGTHVGSLGQGWVESSADLWNAMFKSPDREHAVDLGGIGFVNLFEWLTVVALMEKALSAPHMPSFRLDLIGQSDSQVLSAREYVAAKRQRDSRSTMKADLELSDRVYRVAGFLESLGTRRVLNNYNQRTAEVFYPGIMKKEADLRSFYKSKSSAGHTVVLGITRIDTKEDCKQFLDEHRILRWKEVMGKRFNKSPLFESEEIWRVLCHELAVNIYEHAQVSGFIAARVIEKPLIGKERVRPWCSATFPAPMNELLPRMGDGFLELCVADAGQGFAGTLKQSFSERTGIPISEVQTIDVLTFAFDELGTCKRDDESWATERHALGRILQIVAKYGGAIRLRSDGTEVVYQSEGGRFERQRNHFGYVPRSQRSIINGLPGAQIQLLLPLLPMFDAANSRESRSILEDPLPRSFRTQNNQVRGHLVPLLEALHQREACVGNEERRRFRQACAALSKEIVGRRPRNELLVLDFSGLNWSEGQFETLLYLLQNVLQSRPVLLVEIDSKLAQAVEKLERESVDTLLDDDILVGSVGAANRSFGDLSESKFLGTYSGVHSTVLGLDKHGREYIFGLLDHKYKGPLLSLIEREAFIEELCSENRWGGDLKESTLRAILNAANPLFTVSYAVSKKGLWRTVWDKQALAQEASRVISEHFEDVAKRSSAWRGSAGKRFYLPWLAEWREDFLEASRILSRGRQADEIAQRLIYRLRLGLASKGKSLGDVRALACVTTPAMLLASAIHRWWPTESPPAVADLGYYVMLSQPKDIPAITASNGGVVIVQDVLDTNAVSEQLINVLKQQDVEVLCVIGFVRLLPDISPTRATPITDGWDTKAGNVPRHAMIETKRPANGRSPKDDEDDTNAFWVEPRSLRPIRYTSLRREFKPGRDVDLDRRDIYLQRFDNPETGCLLTAGHYVFGRRHYIVTVDVRRALTGEIGESVARWLADICEGIERSQPEEWESERGFALRGEVTGVLMPLHSQVHYLWPRVENLLAQRGRRQPNWWLEATLFTGAGPSYFLPLQFRYQIEQAVLSAVNSKRNPDELIDNPLRILIVDDAIATARTAETILTTIMRLVEKLFDQLGKKPEACAQPIEWIRYFALLNQMGYAHHILWRNIPQLGRHPTAIAFEEFAPFMGVPIYDEDSCPLCRDRARLRLLSVRCDQVRADVPRQWVERRIKELRPIAVDSSDFRDYEHPILPTPIDVLAPRSRPRAVKRKYVLTHTDTAIWRFYELMYLSYPPNDVLRSLFFAKPPLPSDTQYKGEYERYRWAVLEWSLHNWSRIKANAARRQFAEAVMSEIASNSEFLERIFELASLHYRDSYIRSLVRKMMGRLAKLERERESEVAPSIEREDRVVRLDTALNLFFLNIPSDDFKDGKGEAAKLLSNLERLGKTISPYESSLLRNLYRALTRPERYADPKWSLETLAETVFRGRDPRNPAAGNHKLLPRLLSDVASSSGGNLEERRLLGGSLALFLAGLKEIEPYCDLSLAGGSAEIKVFCEEILKWLKHPPDSTEGRTLIPELTDLLDELAPRGEFWENFNRFFHSEVEQLGCTLSTWAKEKGKDRLEFTFSPIGDSQRCRVLTNVNEFLVCLSNRAIDRILEKDGGGYKSKIEVLHLQGKGTEDRLKFRILTNFDSLPMTEELTSKGPSGNAERSLLGKFGAEFDQTWTAPRAWEGDFNAAFEITIMAGFVPKRER